MGRFARCARGVAAAWLVWAMLSACGDNCPKAGGTRVRFDPSLREPDGTPAGWLAYPFPSDHRRTDSGTIRLADFPNPADAELVRNYARYGEQVLDGFGTNSPVYLAFDGPIDPTSLPADPGLALSPEAVVQLVDVGESSPEFGRRFPVRLEYWLMPGKYVAASSLAAAPGWGVPLREQGTYALLVTDGVRDAGGKSIRAPALLERLLGQDVGESCVEPAVSSALLESLDRSFAQLRRLLKHDDIDPTEVRVATVFTTQSVTPELATIHDQVSQSPPGAPLADGWQELDGQGGFARSESFQWSSTATVDYWVMEGRFSSPNYQAGSLPYASPRDGGAFNLVDGLPAPDHVESLRFVLTIPKAPPANGRACYPIVEFAHGTGGDAYNLTDGTAGRLAARGLAGVAIDQPLHGLRDEGRSFDVELMSFNLFNPAAARAIFRQSAVDTFSLTRMLRQGFGVPAEKSPTGAAVCFDPEHLGFFGHSQGGLTGSIAAAYESGLGDWVLSGAGGGLSTTLMQRKDIVDFEEFLGLLLYLEASDEPLSEMHPAIGLVQTLVEVTDPVNYSPTWLDVSASRSMLVTSGRHDAATPYLTASALAVSGRVPVVEPVVLPIPAYDWIGLPPAVAPLTGNADGRTAGFIQWTNDINRPDYDSHFVIFYRPEAIHASMRFLESAAYEAAPVIEREPDADVR